MPSSRLSGPLRSRPPTLSASPVSEASSTQSSLSPPDSTHFNSSETAVTSNTPLQWDIPPIEQDLAIWKPPSPQNLQSGHYPELEQFTISIPRSLRFNDVWKDIRDPLPPPLQDVLYHYEYTTSLTLASDDLAKAAWRSSVPELAHQHDFLVNCVLSVASLHLARLHEGQTEKNNMNAIAASRMNKALVSYRTALEHITAENAAALFASSTLTAVYLFRTAALDIENLRATIPPGTVVPPIATVDKMLSCVLRTIWALRGPLTVLLSGWDWVVSGAMQSVAARKWWPRKSVPATARAQREDDCLAALESLWLDSDRASSPHCHHLSGALAYLREAYALVSQLTLPERYPPMTAVPYSIDDESLGVLTDRGAIFVWSTRISRDFIQLLEMKDRDALIILAHYAVLPGRVRNVWWLEGLGADIVTAIAMAIGPQNWGLIAWPAQVVGVDLDNAFGVRKDALEGKLDELRMEVI